MKSIKHYFKYFAAFFVLTMSFVFFNSMNSNKASAIYSGYNYYINTKSGIVDDYSSNGKNRIKDTIEILSAYKEGSPGYLGRDAWIDSITIGINNVEYKVPKKNIKVEKYTSSYYGDYNVVNLNSKGYMEKITIKGLHSLINDENNYNSSTFVIGIVAKFKAGMFGAITYTFEDISYYFSDGINHTSNGGTIKSAIINKGSKDAINRSLNSYYSSQGSSAITLTGNLDKSEVFYNKNNKSHSLTDYSLKVKVTPKLKANSITIYILDEQGNEYSAYSNFQKQSSYYVANFNGEDFTDFLNIDGNHTYTIYQYFITVEDYYGTRATININRNSSYNRVIKTYNQKPTLNSVYLSSLTPTRQGLIMVDAKFNLTNLDFDDFGSYQVCPSEVAFNVGNSIVKKTYTGCIGLNKSGNNNSGSVTNEYIIYSSEGIGDISFNSFSGTIKDGKGGEFKYSNAKVTGNVQEEGIKLESNSAGSSVDFNGVSYFYNGSSFSMDLKLTGAKDTSVDKIYLKNDTSEVTYTPYDKLTSTTPIVKDSSETITYTIKDDSITLKDEITFTKLVLENVCLNDACQDVTIDIDVKFNVYQTISVDTPITNKDSFSIKDMNIVDNSATSISDTQISITNSTSVIELTSCSIASSNSVYTVDCSYSNNGVDGISKVTVNRGAITLSDGKRNEKLEFDIITNKNNPTLKILNNDKIIKLNNKNYYKGGESINVELNDNYCNEATLSYYFIKDGVKYNEKKLAISCSNNVLTSTNTVSIPLPSEDEGNYTFKYTLTSDSISGSEVSSEVYVLTNSINLDNISLKINDDEMFLTKKDDHFSSVSVDLTINNLLDNLLEAYTYKFNNDIAFTRVELNDSSSSHLEFDINNREDLKGLNAQAVIFSITLMDKLSNSLTKEFTIIIDTVDPIDPDYTSKEENGKYIITISNFNSYNEGDSINLTYTDTETHTLTCIKATDSKCEFTIDSAIFKLQAIDMANNKSKISTYSAKQAHANLTDNEYLKIQPISDELKVNIRIYVFSYSNGNLDINEANNVCSNATTNNCYKEYKVESLDHQYAGDELNMRINQFDLRNNHSYLFYVSVGESKNYLLNDSNNIPRLDLAPIDTQGPSLVDSSISSNPKYVSDSKDNNREFKFDFTFEDVNFNSDSKYEYLILKDSALSGDYTMSLYEFNNYIVTCNKNFSSDSSNCGQWSKGNQISYTSVSGNLASGSITINKNGGLINGSDYVIFIKTSDSKTNYTIEAIGKFTNISDSSSVKYKDGDSNYELVNGNSFTTLEGQSIVQIINNYENENIKIESITLNGRTLANTSFTMGSGVNILVIKDSLGNNKTIVGNIGARSKPIIEIYNKYNEEYFKINVSGNYYYNNENLANLYLKIKGINIESIMIANTPINKGTDAFNKITKDEYGICLNDVSIKELFSGSGKVVISATNINNGTSSVEINVDKDNPEIQILGGTKQDATIRIGDNDYVIGLDGDASSNSYAFRTDLNYLDELTYNLLFDKLSLNIDSHLFKEIKDSNNLIVKLDGVKVSNFDTTLYTLNNVNTITVEYFDLAGNKATTLSIKLKIVDKQAPIVNDFNNTIREVENNTLVSVLDSKVYVSDNFDELKDIKGQLTITSNKNNEVVKRFGFGIDGEFILSITSLMLEEFNFINADTYTLTLVLKDSNGNVSKAFTQTVIAKDTTPPTKETNAIIKDNKISVTVKTSINLPKYVDKVDSSIVATYYPKAFDLYYSNRLVDTSFYTYEFKNDILDITFNKKARLGNYKIVFVVSDNNSNYSKDEYIFTLIDSIAPIINVYSDGKLISNNDNSDISLSVNYGSDLNISAQASDNYYDSLKVSITGLNKVDTFNVGDYIVTFTSIDGYDNKSSVKLTITVNDDGLAPVIDSVKYGEFILTESSDDNIIYNYLNINYASINVLAHDNGAISKIEIDVNGEKIDNDSFLALSDYVDTVLTISVSDSAKVAHTVTKVYYLKVDSKMPLINGVDNKTVYKDKVNVTISDDHLTNFEIYKDNVLIESGNESNSNFEFTKAGNYKIVASDKHDNKTIKIFKIIDTFTFNLGKEENLNADSVYLAKVNFNKNNGLELHFNEDEYNLQDNDMVYLIVKVPNSDISHMIHFCNGGHVNMGSDIVIDTQVVENESNINVVEKIDGDYYLYLAVVKAKDKIQTPTKEDNTTLINVLVVMVSVFMLILLVYLLFKFRRKVRAA